MKWLMVASHLAMIVVGGLLAAMAYPFRWNDTILEPNFFTFTAATLGLILWLPTSIQPKRPRHRFLRGWLGGIVFFSVVLYWIVPALRTFGALSWPVAIFSTSTLVLYCALYPALWSLIVGTRKIQETSAIRKIILWASLWVTLEALRQWFFTGFPWGEFGYAFASFKPFARSASFWGAHGLTFIWIFFVGAAIHIDHWLRNPQALRSIVTAGLVIGAVISLTPIFSLRKGESISVRVGSLQPNVPQEIKWSPTRGEDHLRNLVELAREAVADRPDFIVWPETSFPYLIMANQSQLPFSIDTPSLVGAVVRDGNVNRNSVLLIEKDQVMSRFDKIHLVPFGEFVPLQDWIPFGKLVQNAGNFAPGSIAQKPLLVTKGESKIAVGPLICYEDIFNRESVRLARAGAQLLVNLTNDAWYGKTSAQLQHAILAQLQVYQTGLPLIRTTNNGQTTFMTIDDRIDFPPYTRLQAVREIDIPVKPKKTFFVWTYPLMEWIWPIIFAIALLWKQSPLRKYQTRKIFSRRSLKLRTKS